MDLLEAILFVICRASWAYLYLILLFFTFYIPILLVYSCTRVGTKIHYLCWKLVILYAELFIVGLLIPFFLPRPRNVANAKFASWFIRKVSYILNMTWELRGANIAALDIGAVICCNHQSAVDIFALNNIWSQFNKMTAIAKREIFYFFPFGPGAWLCGLRYIDRRSTKQAYSLLTSTEKFMVEEKAKVLIYPEGTRNNKGGFMPFKKGAFITAIQAQVPIIPVVNAPYYYMDEPNEKFLFEKGHNIISVLEPIPTKGLTLDDVDKLKDKTYSIMFKEYEKLREEVTLKSRLPDWVNKTRPRLTLVNRKFKKP
uniref:1-acylglycerol-3-phosphate O-acyltransferase n=1 Tax=Culicoides sonorensis TaxID=179676 RepID=A0A336M0Y0_CULSO